MNKDFLSVSRYCWLWLLSFCLGVIGHSFTDFLLPLYTSAAACLACIAISIRYRWVLIPTCFLIGFVWANFFATQLYQSQLDNQLVKKDVVISGQVLGVPTIKNGVSKFLFEIESLTFDKQTFPSPGKVLLKAYDDPERFKAGQCWVLQVRLKQPRSTQNPGIGANYEKYLFANRIRSTGYVRMSNMNKVDVCQVHDFSVSPLRERIWLFVKQHFSGRDGLGILAAVTLGIRSDITTQQYTVLRNTGTAHLMAISGLHIGIVATMVMFLVGAVYRRVRRPQSAMPVYLVAVTSAVIVSFGYALLAGMTIPTRRALLMFVFLAIFILVRRQKNIFELLLLVLSSMLLIDPLAPLLIGFWLSFLAVALILLCLQRFSTPQKTGEPNKPISRQKLKLTLIVQLCLSVGLAPVIMLFFGYFSVISPAANFVSIPIIGMLVVPIALLGLLAFFFHLTSIALLLFDFAIVLIEFNLSILQWLNDLSFASIHLHEIPSALLVLCLIGFLGLLSSKAMPARLASFVFILPLFLYQPSRPDEGDYVLTMLDVGQGLSMVVETKNHTLVYDTGPRYRSGFNAARYILVPFLQSRGIARIQTLILSHEHNDHVGGYQFLRSTLPIDKVISGVAKKFPHSTACMAGQKWQWDDVKFEMLWPPRETTGAFEMGNNASCVIKITSRSGASALLTGDIEKPAELALVKKYGRQLDIDILQVPHQGSKTSSIASFIDRTSPDYALFSVGYANRYHHPHNSVVNRYNQLSIKQLRTDQSGAVIISVGDEVDVTRYRDNLIGYWYNEDTKSGDW